VKVRVFLLSLFSLFFFFLPESAFADTCQSATIHVGLALGLPKNQTVSGTLCTPSSYTSGTQVDVLVHGASYNRIYWDFPTNYPQYSYVKKTLGAGRATFAYDRLGTGATSRPVSALVTTGTDSYVLHQIVQWLRDEKDFPTVNSIGHSFGSIMAVDEAATYNDVDRVVATGLSHALGTIFTTGNFPFIPAALDPKFAGQGYDAGYLTSQQNTRGGLFYSSTGDSTVIAEDEATKDVASATQFGNGIAELQVPAGLNISNSVHAPVLVVLGQQDILFCGVLLDCSQDANVQNFEAPFYTSAASLTARTIANTGHDIALHPSNDTSFGIINDWINSH